MIFLAAAIIGFLVASFQDLRSRTVSPYVSWGLVVIGLAMHASLSAATADAMPFIMSAAFAIGCFFFAYILYCIGAWAGGDVKLFTALGALLPSFNGLDFFPFAVLAASLIAVLPFAALYLLYYIVKDPRIRRSVRDDVPKWFRKGLLSPFYIIAAVEVTLFMDVSILASIPLVYIFYRLRRYFVTAVAFFATYAFLANTWAITQYFAFLLAMSFVTFLGVASFRAAKKHVLRVTKRVSELREGDIPAQDAYLVDGRVQLRELKMLDFRERRGLLIDSRKAAGLSEKEIKQLKKLGVTSLVIRKSLPFVPILTLGIAIAAIAAIYI